jgi:hypothetical protein
MLDVPVHRQYHNDIINNHHATSIMPASAQLICVYMCNNATQRYDTMRYDNMIIYVTALTCSTLRYVPSRSSWWHCSGRKEGIMSHNNNLLIHRPAAMSMTTLLHYQCGRQTVLQDNIVVKVMNNNNTTRNEWCVPRQIHHIYHTTPHHTTTTERTAITKWTLTACGTTMECWPRMCLILLLHTVWRKGLLRAASCNWPRFYF